MKQGRNPVINLIATEWKYLGDRKKTFVWYVIFFTIAGVISLSTPLIIGLVFNSIQKSINSMAEFKTLIFLISLLLVKEIVFWVFHGTARVMETRTGFLVGRNYTNAKIKKVLSLPVEWHKDHHSGDTIDKINRGAAAITGFSEFVTFQIVYAVVSTIGSIVILFFFDVFAAVIALVFSFIVLFSIVRFDRKLDKYYREINEYSNKVSAAIFDYISNIFTVISLRLKRTVRKEMDSRLMASFEVHKKQTLLNEIKWGYASIAIACMTVIVLIFKAYRDYTTTGIILIGTLYILYGYLATVGDTFFRFAEMYGRIVTFNSSIVSAYPIDEEYKKINRNEGGRLPKKWEEIDIKNVSFSYDKEGKQAHLDDINLKIKRGKKIAFIGESGSGKSTILTVIRGLYSPENGKVVVDGLEEEKGFAKLKEHVTLIPQDPEIFNNSIKYNLTMDLPYSAEEIKEAIELAQFEKVVKRLEKGLATNVLEKGVSLSGGEKQRLALARGILAAKSSSIILMDEPTSSVDNANEVKIYDNIFNKFKNKAVISSIHRLNLLNKFDYIYMFEDGKIVAEGTFADLKSNTKFHKVWRKYLHEKDEK